MADIHKLSPGFHSHTIADLVKSIPQTLRELTESINLCYLLQHTSRSTPLWCL